MTSSISLEASTSSIDGRISYEVLLDLCGGALGAQVDIGWVYAGGENPVALLDRNAERVHSLHIKDFVRKGDGFAEVVPGAGEVDIASCLRFAEAKACPVIIDMDSFPNGMKRDLSRALSALE